MDMLKGIKGFLNGWSLGKFELEYFFWVGGFMLFNLWSGFVYVVKRGRME